MQIYVVKFTSNVLKLLSGD